MKKLFTLLTCLAAIATAAFADGPFRNHRYDAFKVLPVNSEQIVFIGNSITNMHEWWEAFGNHNVVNRGVSGAITDEALANIEAIAAGKPRKVFIMLGTNDLGTNGINTTEHVLTNMNLIVERFKQTSPDTEIYIQSILPSTSGIRTLAALQAANSALQEMCTEKGATYIDLWDDMMGITSNSISYDKLHLTAGGYKIWCDKIAQYVNDAPDAKSVYGTEAEANGGLGGANGMRATVFSKLPVKSDDILIIGDEMINGGEWHELLKSNKVKNRGTAWGYPGPSLADMQKMVTAILRGGTAPAQIFLYAGVSDVNGSTALATVLNNYKNVVAKIKELAPTTKLTIMSLQPRSNADANSNRVAPFNTLLEQYATDNNIAYLDIYTDFINGSVANTAYFTGDYLYGKGYAKVAQKIAAAIGSGITAISDDEANALYTRFNNRTALGNAILTAAALPEGDAVGEYTATSLAGVKQALNNAYAALATSQTASDTFTDLQTALTTATNELLPLINKPAASANGNDVWYKLYTPNRDSRYLSSNGANAGVTGAEENNYAHSMWKFIARSNGSFDIVNRKDGSYLAPTAAYNSQITTSSTRPTNGWTLSYANSPGLFIISSGTVQLNQTQQGLGYKVYNWSNGQTGTDRADSGCQYRISLCTGEPDEEPEEIEPIEPTITIDALAFESYPYAIKSSTAKQLMAMNDVTIAMEVIMPATLSGRRALISVSDPSQPAATQAQKENANYFAYGHFDSKMGYFASSLASDRFTAGSVTADAVTRIVFVLDRTNNTYKAYVNGTKQQEQTFPASGYALQTFSKYADSDNRTIYIGGGVVNNADVEVFQGKIHTVQFFDKALSEEEIATITYPGSKYYIAANTKQSDGSYINRYLYVNNNSLTSGTEYEISNPAYEWAMELNGKDAYYFKNGNGKYLSYANKSLQVADNAYSFKLTDDAVHTGVGAKSLYNPTSSGGKYMVMAAGGGSFNQNSIPVNNGSWCSDYILTAVNSNIDGYQPIVEAINQAQVRLARTQEGTAPGCFSAESRATLQAAIGAAKEKNSTEGLTDEEVAAAAATLDAALEAYNATRNDVKYSTAGNETWYYITSASTKGYCTEKAITSVSTQDGVAMKFATKRLDPNMVWCLEKNSAGKVAVRNFATGRYFAANPANGTSATAQYVYTVAKWEDESLNGLGYTIKADGYNPVHAQEHNSVIVNWAAENNGASLWAFKPLSNEELASTAALSSTTVGGGITTTGIGNTKEPLLRVQFMVEGLNGSAAFNGISGSTGNTTGAVSKLYIYSVTDEYEYRAGKEGAVLIAETTPAADGSFCFTFNNSQTLPSGSSLYYWLVADISETATEGEVINASITSYKINNGTVAENAGNPATYTTVFLTASTVEYSNTHGSRYYRIPAIATAMNGWLVAVTDKRWGSNGDLPNNIDVVARVSKDNGKTWTEPVTIAGTAELGGDYGHGDPAIVTDRVTGDIFVLVTSKKGFYYGTPDDPARLKYIVSHDNGLTWDAPVDITDMIYGTGCSDDTRKNWHSMFFSSGAALQTSKGTLMCVAPVRTTNTSNHSLFEAQILRSDDHGKTWTCNAVPALLDADESKIVELSDGTLLVKSRKQGGGKVYYATSTDDGQSWTTRAQFADVYDPGCNGDVIRVTINGKEEGLLLSVPDATSRKNVTVYHSDDEANSWPIKKTICPGGSAYSSMTVLADGTIGIYFEEDCLEGGYQMRYARFSLPWLTGKPTGIECITEGYSAPKGIYDLTGRKIENITTPGIYIVDGKKVVVE